LEVVEAMPREQWTDDRMDDLVKHVDAGFARVDAQFGQVHEDTRELRREGAELRQEMKAQGEGLRRETKELGAELNQRFDALQRTIIAAILTGFIGLLVAHFA
jgi:hypothetical protein